MWEVIFMLVILKIPLVYLGLVVYWAIKAEPQPYEGAARLVATDPEPQPGWSRSSLARRRPRIGPHGSPARTYQRTARAALARAEARR